MAYVSATKRLVDLEVTTFDAFDAYWISRGWSQRVPIKTESRIDTPRYGAKLTAGTEVAVAGVAWPSTEGSRVWRCGWMKGRGPTPSWGRRIRRNVAPVGLAMDTHCRRPPDPGTRHRRHRRGPDIDGRAACPERRERRSRGQRQRELGLNGWVRRMRNHA